MAHFSRKIWVIGHKKEFPQHLLDRYECFKDFFFRSVLFFGIGSHRAALWTLTGRGAEIVPTDRTLASQRGSQLSSSEPDPE
jgi:hypothetical protein